MSDFFSNTRQAYDGWEATKAKRYQRWLDSDTVEKRAKCIENDADAWKVVLDAFYKDVTIGNATVENKGSWVSSDYIKHILWYQP